MAGRTTLQYGSKGSDVKELQQYLNNNGYNLSVDGDFGDNTLSAVKDYQQKNGLSVDGIVGNNTWGKLLGSTNSSGYAPTVAPTIAPAPTAPKYDTSSWDDSEKGSSASGAYEAAKEALNNYGSFTFSENEWLNNIKDGIKNYGEFSYDVNSDALYQQYAEQYARMGNMASADVMGQAAAMTGGYGNSYAASAGNQAYQSYIQQLNDKVPELYQLALDRHNMGKEELYNQYSMLLSEYEREYGLYSDEYNKLLDSLGLARDDYYSGADMFYTEQGNKNNVLGQEFSDAMALWEADTNNKWAQAEWDESANRYANEEAWRQKEWDESQKRYEESKNVTSTGSSSGSGSGSGSSGKGNNNSNNGNNSNDNTASGVPNTIRDKAATFTDNDSLDAYLTSQRDAGKITDEQMGELYIEYEIPSLDKRNWTLSGNGGINWFGGIDNNAKVKDQYGNSYELGKLVDALVAEGMSKDEAKKYVKKLQSKLGA